MSLPFQRTPLFVVLCAALATACGSSSSNAGTGGGAGTSGAGAGAGGSGGTGGASAGGSGGAAAGSGGTAGSSGAAGSGGPDNGGIGEWTDSPGKCPPGMTQVDIDNVADLASAARAEGAYASDPPDTCYFIHNGDYTQSGALLYVLKGGVAGGTHRWFLGESRAGVVIHGRGSVADGIGDVTIKNLTFDLSGYSASGSFNTLGLGTGKNIVIDHVTFTGDCATGLKGGHIETDGTDGVLIDSCLIEKFGHCSGGGHLDHGIYLAGGSNITIKNCVIRDNSSRGIQMYTQGGQYGTLDNIHVERCRIYGNGHADYEDGIVINGSKTGTITNVSVSRNLIYKNYYSGVRFAGGAESSITFENNTFDANGAGSSSPSRSEVNIDAAGGGAGTTFSKNLFNVGNSLINGCYDASSLGFAIQSNFVHGTIPSGAAGNCVAKQTTGDPGFVDAANGDYHTTNPAAAGFGAYAP